MKRMTALEFTKNTGKPPVLDQLERVNCKLAGDIMHFHCGWCPEHNRPRYSCMCSAPESKNSFEKWKSNRNLSKRHSSRFDDIHEAPMPDMQRREEQSGRVEVKP